MHSLLRCRSVSARCAPLLKHLRTLVAVALILASGATATPDDLTSVQEEVSSAIRQSESAQARGDLVAAQAPLERAAALANQSDRPALRAAVGAARGHLSLTIESPEAARPLLEEALRLAEDAGAHSLQAIIHTHIGNAYAIDAGTLAGEAQKTAWLNAKSAYQRALKLLPQPDTTSPTQSPDERGKATAVRARVLANLARADSVLEAEGAERAIQNATRAIKNVVSPEERAALLLHVAETLAPSERGTLSAESRLRTHAIAREALSLAETADNDRLRAHALLMLAHLYLGDGRARDALTLLDRAIEALANENDPVARFRAWLAKAEIYRSEGARDLAISAYAQALDEAEMLAPIRARSYGLDPRLSNSALQTTHLAYVDLLLRRASDKTKTSARPQQERGADLALAQQALERQKVQELRDFFDDECVDAALRTQVDAGTIDDGAALIYPIALDDRLELIVSHPKGRVQITVPVSASELRETALAFRQLLEVRSHRGYLRPARKLYDWLIRPIEAVLAAWQVDTLVFVPDAAIRAIPMSALHDGEHFLIERYAVATTPGINLTQPRPLGRANRLALASGLSVAVDGFPALPFVEDEIDALKAVLPTEVLLNDTFTPDRLERGLETRPVSVLHIATHARFEGDSDAFILTHDGRISMTTLSEYLGLFRDRDEPLELLMLSACETAAGDERAALGLAGLAVRSGARSAIGTLWSINDSAAGVVAERFYRAAFDEDAPQTRAHALAQAQRSLIETRAYRHPAYWAPFLLIGSWL